tara:strand:+ start:310 stop:606 length:297 start_codon:yes stop_codon:yes gene_type:complete
MPSYNVTVSTEFTMQVDANSPEEAVNSFTSIPNEENDLSISIVSVEEIRPQTRVTGSDEYVSLRSFHNSQAQEQNNYNAFAAEPISSSFYTRLVPFIR